jgi:hypothetical protein
MAFSTHWARDGPSKGSMGAASLIVVKFPPEMTKCFDLEKVLVYL